MTGFSWILDDFEWSLVDVGGFRMIFTGFMWCEMPKIQRNVVFACENYISLTKSSGQAKQISSQQGETGAGRQFLVEFGGF